MCTLILSSGWAQAQFTLALNGAYVLGTNSQSLKVNHSQVSQKWYTGYQFNVSTGFQLKESPLEITTRIGMKHLVSNGSLENLTFSTETYKLSLGLGSIYHFESKVAIGALMTLENNLDFENFISQTSDLFRFSFQGEIYYPVFDRIDVSVLYSIALTPLSDHYLLINPQHQIAFGLKYSIL
ncbi:MAG: hypothetical protein ACI9GM_000994 [Salibacteraceae bacterium]|jgi:hypothetical protein